MLGANQDLFEQIRRARLVPVVVVDEPSQAIPLAKALLAGGLNVMEVTFRTSAAVEAIRQIAAEVPEILLGAGTILSDSNVKAAKSAGARFLVSPGFSPSVVQAAQDLSMPIIPGINSPTGVEQAMSFDLRAVKFFPAEPSGGVPFLKALSGPYREMHYVPTGGINAQNLASYLELPAVLACGGSWMVEPRLLREGRYDAITKLTAGAVALTKRPN